MDIDLQLFKNIMAEARHNDDLLDSYSPCLLYTSPSPRD